MIETDRLVLRGWLERDLEPFHAMSNDPQVMATLGPPMSWAETEAAIARIEAIRAMHGYTFWALERREDGAFLGFCGIKPGAAGTPIEHDVEIGWRLAHAYWGRGYAREAAQASLAWGWANTDAPRIAAITTPGNERSRRLMERLGMARAPGEDFDHPNVPDGSPLKAHITYRIARP